MTDGKILAYMANGEYPDSRITSGWPTDGRQGPDPRIQ
jgi:hypothetical protein